MPEILKVEVPVPFAPSVLLVDDERSFRESTKACLEDLGYSCVATGDVESGLDLLESTDIEIVVADIRMRGNTELEFVKRLVNSENGPPVIIVTGYPSVETAVRALEFRVAAYMIKPFEISDLSSRIDEALESRAQRHSLEKVRDSLKDLYENLAHGPVSGNPGAAQARLSASPRRQAEETSHNGPRDSWGEAGLTSRERELLGHLIEGYRTSTIAKRLFISPHTVRRHLKSIFLKLEVSSQAELLEKVKPWPDSPRPPS